MNSSGSNEGRAIAAGTDVRVTGDADGVATIVLDRPRRRNALTGAMMEQFTAALTRVASDPAVRCVVVTGEGGFCSGIDIDWLSAIPTEDIVRQGVDFYRLPQSTVRALIALPVPTIAAVDGPAIGLGLDLALACDSRFIGPDGWLRQGWAAGGIIPATGGTHLLGVRAPGAIWRLLDGQPKVGPVEAERLGLGEAAPRSALESARARAANLAALPSSTVRGYVSLDRARVRAGWDEHLREAAEIQLALFAQGRYRAALAGQLARPGGSASQEAG